VNDASYSRLNSHTFGRQAIKAPHCVRLVFIDMPTTHEMPVHVRGVLPAKFSYSLVGRNAVFFTPSHDFLVTRRPKQSLPFIYKLGRTRKEQGVGLEHGHEFGETHVTPNLCIQGHRFAHGSFSRCCRQGYHKQPMLLSCSGKPATSVTTVVAYF